MELKRQVIHGRHPHSIAAVPAAVPDGSRPLPSVPTTRTHAGQQHAPRSLSPLRKPSLTASEPNP